MNATVTATCKVNWNGRKAAPTCACGKRSYCDNSCNTFAKREARAELAELADLGLGMSFEDWKELYGGAL